MELNMSVAVIVNIKGKNDDLVDIEPVLKFFFNNKRQATKTYMKFVGEKETKIETMNDSDFHESIRPIRPEENYENRNVPIEEIIENTCAVLGVDEKEISQKLRTKGLVQYRKVIILLCRQYSNVSNKELAERLNLSEPTVSNILSYRSNCNKLNEIVEKVMSVIKL